MSRASAFKFDLEGLPPQVVAKGGTTVPKEVLATTFGVPPERFDDFDLNVEYIAPQ